MRIKSTAFDPEKNIPQKHTCDGMDMSPDISWEGAPENTKSFALTMEDPDAPSGTWVHWVVYNIPPQANHIASHIPATERLSDGTLQGRNSFRKIGYGGPCPPQGHGPHRYFFRIFALDALPGLKPGASKEELKAAMAGHILSQAELVGRFER